MLLKTEVWVNNTPTFSDAFGIAKAGPKAKIGTAFE